MTEKLVISEIFSGAVSRFPDKVALQIKRGDQWQRFTYRDIEGLSLKIAAFLIKQGFRKTDTACLLLENRPEWGIIYLGIIRAGLICVPVDPQLNPQEIKNLITDSAAKVIFCPYDIFIKKIKQNIQGNPIKIAVLDAPDIHDESLIKFSDIDTPIDKSILPDILPQDTASLIYTSGTTGEPKGVLLSHFNICSNFKSIDGLNLCFPSDNGISILPLHHTYAFMITFIVPLFLGITITYCPSFNPQQINQILKEADISILVGVPQLFLILHKTIFERIRKVPFLFLPFALWSVRMKIRRDRKNLRLLVSGGARLEPKIARDLSKLLGVKLVEGYGLTETSPVVTLNPPGRIKLGSVGKPIPGVRIKILHPDKSGIGEVLIKGPNVMQGYFKHPEWTEGAIKEEWFYSGDLGYIDREGYLYLVGREKEVIVLSSGKNIYPEELEEHYGRSPYIKEICILSRQEEKFGRTVESLHAVIVPDLEYFRKTKETDIRAKVRWELENSGKNLSSYQHIMGFTVTKEELPRTALKKIKRYQVREKYAMQTLSQPQVQETALLEEGLKGLDKDTAQKTVNYISKQLKKPVSLDSHLEIDLGIDSLTRVELGLGLEEIFQIKISDELLYTASTIREVIVNISNLMGQAPAGIERTERGWREILSRAPEKKMTDKVRIELNLLDRLVTWIFKIIFLFIFRAVWFLSIKGRGNLPPEGPYIICSNHASYLDGFVIFSSLRLKQALNLFFLGYSEILEHPLISWGTKAARLIPIDPATHLTEAMQAAAFVLAQKKILCIFPEGRRSIDENPGEFKKGIGILLKELDIPAIPVYIKGSHYSWPRTSRLARLFYPLKIIFGRPFLAKELLEKRESEPGLDDYEIIARNLREEVMKLAC